MARRLQAAVVAVWLLASAAAARPQPAEPADSVLGQAIALQEAEGEPAALEFLVAHNERNELQPPAKALLGSLLLSAGRGEEAYSVLEPLSRFDDAPPGILFDTWRAASLSGRAEQRIDLLERSVALEPASPAARQLGLILGSRGRLQEGFLTLIPWIRVQPADTMARLAAAHMAIELRRVPQAEELLAGLSRDIPQAQLLRARILFLSDDPTGALEILQGLGEVSSLPPGFDRDRRLTMAHAYMALGDAGSAAGLLEAIAGRDPALNLVLSQAQSQSGDVDGALATVTPVAGAVVRNPAAFEPGLAVGLLLQYGRQLIATGTPAAAIEPLTLATELLPDNEQAWQSLGQALAVAGRRDEAVIALERFRELAESQSSRSDHVAAVENDLNDPTGRELRQALDLLADDRAPEALEVVRTERRMAPRDPRIPIVESKILHRLGRLDEALNAAQQAVELAPERPGAYHQRATIAAASERLEAAEADLRRALEIDPNHLESLYDLALLLISQQREDEARALLERVLQIDPDHQAAAAALIRLDGG